MENQVKPEPLEDKTINMLKEECKSAKKRLAKTVASILKYDTKSDNIKEKKEKGKTRT